MLCQGLLAVKIDEEAQGRFCKASNVDTFKSYFGKHPKHLCRVWRDLQLYHFLDLNIYGRSTSFKGFLIANNYLKCYQNLKIQSSLFSLPKNLTGEPRGPTNQGILTYVITPRIFHTRTTFPDWIIKLLWTFGETRLLTLILETLVVFMTWQLCVQSSLGCCQKVVV